MNPNVPPARLPATLEDTIGPYYPLPFVDLDRADLRRPHPGLTLAASGTPMVLSGRVLDCHGVPVDSCLLEFWQADARGVLRSPRNAGERGLDPWFTGHTRIYAADGSFRLHTVAPGPIAPEDATETGRAPHITITIFSDGITRLVTQVFFADDPLRQEDPLLLALEPALRPRLMAQRVPGPDGQAHYRIDLVLAGGQATPFFDDLSEPGHGPGRQLEPGPTDRSAEARVPRTPLHRIPAAARRSFVPYLPQLPGVPAGANDLTHVYPGRPAASGEVIEVTGRVTNELGRPLPGVLVELWNANHHGRYTHVNDLGEPPLDLFFRDFGCCVTDAEGLYRFVTIRPGSYLARPDIGRWRPRHLHLSLRGGTARLITQMYFPDDPHNARDPMFILLGDAQQRHLGQPCTPTAAGISQGYRYDIVVGGLNARYYD